MVCVLVPTQSVKVSSHLPITNAYDFIGQFGIVSVHAYSHYESGIPYFWAYKTSLTQSFVFQTKKVSGHVLEECFVSINMGPPEAQLHSLHKVC